MGGKENPNTNNQILKAHLHDNVGDLIHVETSGSRWGDLFTNIKFPVDYSKTTAYINGNMVQNFQTQPIHPDESLVLAKSGTCSD